MDLVLNINTCVNIYQEFPIVFLSNWNHVVLNSFEDILIILWVEFYSLDKNDGWNITSQLPTSRKCVRFSTHICINLLAIY